MFIVWFGKVCISMCCLLFIIHVSRNTSHEICTLLHIFLHKERQQHKNFRAKLASTFVAIITTNRAVIWLYLCIMNEYVITTFPSKIKEIFVVQCYAYKMHGAMSCMHNRICAHLYHN